MPVPNDRQGHSATLRALSLPLKVRATCFLLTMGGGYLIVDVYVATIEGALRDPRNDRALIESGGKGKAFGEVGRSGKDDDRDPINRAVRGALNDLCEKLERNRRWEHL